MQNKIICAKVSAKFYCKHVYFFVCKTTKLVMVKLFATEFPLILVLTMTSHVQTMKGQ